MKRFTAIVLVLLAGVVALGAGAEKEAVPAAAMPAMQKYQAAVAAADAKRNEAVEKARLALVGDLKSAQKTALQHGDVDAATACAVLAKEKSKPTMTRQTFAGSTWNMPNGRLRLNGDGTISHSDPQYGGTWTVTGERTVAIFFSNGFIDVWKFDQEGKAYKAMSHKPDHEYSGTLVR